MTKAEAERAIRHLCHVWAKETGHRIAPENAPSFGAFYAWVQANHSPYLTFRTTTGVAYDVEMWFDAEMKQAWRN